MEEKNKIDQAKHAVATFTPSKGLSEDLAKKSARILKKEINTTEDLFLYCAALNYLNSFVKKDESKTAKILREELNEKYIKSGYSFKRYVNSALFEIMAKKIQDSSLTIFHNGSLVMITVGGVQFSFHDVKIFEETKDLLYQEEKNVEKGKPSKISSEKWHGVRLQPIALPVFKYAENLENLTINTIEKENN